MKSPAERSSCYGEVRVLGDHLCIYMLQFPGIQMRVIESDSKELKLLGNEGSELCGWWMITKMRNNRG